MTNISKISTAMGSVAIVFLALLVIEIIASNLQDACKTKNGIYLRRSCYMYIDVVTKNWYDAMTYCNNLIEGYPGHLVHVTDSGVLAVLKDLASTWGMCNYAYIGIRHDSSIPGPVTLQYTQGKYAIDTTNLLNVPVSKLFVLKAILTDDSIVDQSEWALVLKPNVNNNQPMDWHMHDYNVSYKLNFFCQTNEKSGYGVSNDGGGHRLLSNHMMPNETATQSIQCLKACKKQPECVEYNFNRKLQICEFSAWRKIDAEPGQFVADQDWDHYERW